jgi:hypothetical protein
MVIRDLFPVLPTMHVPNHRGFEHPAGPSYRYEHEDIPSFARQPPTYLGTQSPDFSSGTCINHGFLPDGVEILDCLVTLCRVSASRHLSAVSPNLPVAASADAHFPEQIGFIGQSRQTFIMEMSHSYHVVVRDRKLAAPSGKPYYGYRNLLLPRV